MSRAPHLAQIASAAVRGPLRSTGIDVFRGVLVLLVILGHFSELTQRHNFMTWIGAGFRMPVFIGLSGYLFNLDQARAVALPALARKYYYRLILPWLVACAVALTITGMLDWMAPLYAIVRPPFHLWFVPVLMFFILTARACRLDRTAMLAIAIPVSIAAMYVFGVGYNIEQYYPWMPDRRYFVYPIYFAFGMWLAERRFNPSTWQAAAALAVIGLLWWTRLFNHPSLLAEVAAELILCLPMIWLLPWLRSVSSNLPLLSRIGRDSLFFYLWHPLAFGLWAAFGISGMPLLADAMLSLLLVWVLIARSRRLSQVLGVRPVDGGGTIRSIVPAGGGSPAISEPAR